jgi:phosphoribosylamine--glycine ligase
VLVDAGVPTARHGAFNDEAPAMAFLDTLGDLFVIKTDGLAAGKGVLVTTDRAEAIDDVRAKLRDGGVVIEEGLTGPEISVFAVCDGTNAVALAPAQDHKRVGDGDTGPNTGGMGAYSPVPAATDEVVNLVMEGSVLPTLQQLTKRGIDYRGVLFAGLMLTPEGPKMLEYNVRFGDPETQVVLPRMTSDLVELLAGAAAGDVCGEPTFSTDAAVTVVCASEHYPATPRVGDPILGIADAEQVPGVTVFCAGVGPGMVTAGGRVLNVTALAPTIGEARERAYEAVGRISWPGMHYRTDIAGSVS